MPVGSFRRTVLFIPAAAAFVFLICFGEKASAAAQIGINACLRSVIPSLFPFLVLTNLILRFEIPKPLLSSLGVVFERIFRIRRTALPAMLSGFVGGYPLGAEAAAACYRQGRCSKEEAERLIIFTDNCSPGFVFGVAAKSLSGSVRIALLLLLLQWSISVLIGILLGTGHQPSESESADVGLVSQTLSSAFTAAVRAGGRSVLIICAYVIFFSVFSAFLPESALIRGIVEMTGGFLLLHGPQSSVIAAFLIGWGGLSVAFQVFSALENTGISAIRYLPLRFLHGAGMALCMLLYRFGIIYLLIFWLVLIAAVFFAKTGRKGTVSEI